MPRVSTYSPPSWLTAEPASRAIVDDLPAPLLPTKNNLYDTSSTFGSAGRSSKPVQHTFLFYSNKNSDRGLSSPGFTSRADKSRVDELKNEVYILISFRGKSRDNWGPAICFRPVPREFSRAALAYTRRAGFCLNFIICPVPSDPKSVFSLGYECEKTCRALTEKPSTVCLRIVKVLHDGFALGGALPVEFHHVPEHRSGVFRIRPTELFVTVNRQILHSSGPTGKSNGVRFHRVGTGT